MTQLHFAWGLSSSGFKYRFGDAWGVGFISVALGLQGLGFTALVSGMQDRATAVTMRLLCVDRLFLGLLGVRSPSNHWGPCGSILQLGVYGLGCRSILLRPLARPCTVRVLVCLRAKSGWCMPRNMSCRDRFPDIWVFAGIAGVRP